MDRKNQKGVFNRYFEDTASLYIKDTDKEVCDGPNSFFRPTYLRNLFTAKRLNALAKLSLDLHRRMSAGAVLCRFLQGQRLYNTVEVVQKEKLAGTSKLLG